MINESDIQEHADIVGSDGQHVGTVDRVEDGRIKLTKSDNAEAHSGHHHFIELAHVAQIDGGRVHLSVSGQDAIRGEEEQDGSIVH